MAVAFPGELEIVLTRQLAATWLFEGWPEAEVRRSEELHEVDGVTTITTTTAFADQAGHEHVDRCDGQQDRCDELEDLQAALSLHSRRGCS